VEHYRSEIGSFCRLCGTLQACDLRPYHLTQWISAHAYWAVHRHSASRRLRSAGWATRQRCLSNPRGGCRPASNAGSQ
jgi:hypothetical protein